jgi:cytochrome c peroxidase
MSKLVRLTGALALGFVLAGASGIGVARAAASDVRAQALALFKPLAATAPGPRAKVELGRKLFHEPRLSKSGAISCNSCHNLATYGVDGRPTSLGHNFQVGDRNAPTVLNARYHVAQFWDGRAKDLAAQAKGPILNPGEMALPDAAAAVAKIKSIPGYQKDFEAAFPGQANPVTYDHIAEAIATFEDTLVTPAPFDRFLQGDDRALTARQVKGLQTFMGKGCISCHQGLAVGGSMYMKFGLVKPYAHEGDPGRFKVTGNESDRNVFKVPSLRNVAMTAPYFHDGKVWDLQEAIHVMGETQLGVNLDRQETADIAAFLESLTGEVPAQARLLPQLSASGPRTAHPEP